MAKSRSSTAELERYHKMLDTCGVPPEAQSKIFAGTLWNILNRKP